MAAPARAVLLVHDGAARVTSGAGFRRNAGILPSPRLWRFSVFTCTIT